MKTLIGALIILLFASLANARGGTDSLSINFIQFTGERDKSLVDSYGFAVDFTASDSDDVLRLNYGVDFQYSKARIYINQVGRNGTYYGSDFKAGFTLAPNAGGKISPFIEVAGLAGIKSLKFDNAQTLVPRDSNSLSFGYRVGIGVELDVFSSSRLRLAVYHVDNKALKLAGQNNYNLSSLTASLGLNF